MFQQLIIAGNIGRDAELKYLQSGRAVCNFSVATSEQWRDDNGEKHEKTTWFRCALWGTRAEAIAKYLVKGKKVMVIGTVNARAYMDNAGQPQASIEVKVEDLKFLGGGERQQDSADFAQEMARELGGDIPF